MTRTSTYRIRVRPESVLVGFGVVMVVGLFLDGWAHKLQRPDGFFTPWHAILYAGFSGAAASWLVEARRARPHERWVNVVASADRIGLTGLVLFGAGAIGDLFWHQLLGVEVNLAALLSPTHLLLMVGGMLALSGPLRSAWRRREAAPGLRGLLPALVSLSLAVGVALFFTIYGSPFGQTVVASMPDVTTDIHDFSLPTAEGFVQVREMWAVTSILLTTVIVVGPVMVLVRRWRLPAGSLVIYGATVALFEGAASEYQRWPLALAPLVAGLAGDAVQRVTRVPAFVGAVVAASLWGTYFAAVALAYGVGWSAELWSGSLVMSAALAAALGLLVQGSRTPQGAAATT